MTFEELLDQAIALLQRRGRLTYRALKRQFNVDDDYLEDLKAELIRGQRLAVDEDGEVLVWTGDMASAALSVPAQGRSARIHPSASQRENPHLQNGPGRRAQAGHGAVRRSQRLDGVARATGIRKKPANSSTRSSR